jgi:uncharacterized protein (TIGR02246 family)
MSIYRGHFSFMLALTCGGLLFHPLLAGAQKTVDRSQDEAALRQTAKQYLSAVERNDRKAMAEFWTPQGVFIDENGQSFKVRDLVDQAADSKNAARQKNKVTMTTIRFLTTDSAIEDGASEITAPGESSPVKGRFSAVWVRQDGKWKLDSLRDSRIVAESIPQRLAVLEPFVGQWSGQNANITMHVTAAWNPAKTYLRRDLSVENQGKVTYTATQQMGWDPDRQEIHSWVFDIHGGHSEGSWSLEGNVWMALYQGVYSNGQPSSATHLVKFLDRDKFAWKMIDVVANGKPGPDFEMTFARGDKPVPQGSGSVPTATSADAAKKATLLAGDAWKRLESEFNQWVSVQVVYTPEQMADAKAEMRAEVEKMSAPELERFITETDSKLKLLMNKDGMEARAWLGQYLSHRTEAYRQKLFGDTPDFFNMTSAQIEDSALRLRAKLRAQQRQQASHDANQSQMANAQLKANAASRAAMQAPTASGGGGQSSGYQSPYQPYQSSHAPAARPLLSVGPLGGVSYTLPSNGF